MSLTELKTGDIAWVATRDESNSVFKVIIDAIGSDVIYAKPEPSMREIYKANKHPDSRTDEFSRVSFMFSKDTGKLMNTTGAAHVFRLLNLPSLRRKFILCATKEETENNSVYEENIRLFVNSLHAFTIEDAYKLDITTIHQVAKLLSIELNEQNKSQR